MNRPDDPDPQTISRYLKNAAELRRLSAKTRDGPTRDALIRAAEAYERLADWLADGNSGSSGGEQS